MSCTPASPDLLYFPCLHPDSVVTALPETVRFLDPGIGDTGDARLFRPADLPLDAATLDGVVRELKRLRAEIRDPKELALLADASAGHFFQGTSFAVREELEDQLRPERVAKRRQVAAQLTLCLASLLEESLSQLPDTEALETRFRAAMAASLGLGTTEEDADEISDFHDLLPTDTLPTADSLTEEFGLPWQRLLSSFWAVLPVETAFFTTDAVLSAAWSEAGVPLTALDPATAAALFHGTLPAGTLLTVRETGWRLLGKTRPDPEAPWLDTPRTVVVLQP